MFKKKKKRKDEAVSPGELRVLDGREAVREMEALLESTTTADAAEAVGLALAGVRAAAVLERGGERLKDPGRTTACFPAHVIHYFTGTPYNQSSSRYGTHEEYHAAAEDGYFQLFARNVQEAADFSLVARRLAELSLVPGICAQDGVETGSGLSGVRLPRAEETLSYLGRPLDEIESPTPAQKLLFGEKRRRIPRLLNPDRPLGIGVDLNREIQFKSRAARNPFFFEHLAALADQAFEEFAALTGRAYARVNAYSLEKADYVVIAQGSVVNSLKRVVALLQRKEKIRVGVLNISMLRPFPGDLVSELLKGKKGVTVLERADRSPGTDGPLTREIRCALDRAVENGAASGERQPHPGYARYESGRSRPLLHSAVYGLGGELPGDDQLRSLLHNMTSGGERKSNIYLGIEFHRTDITLPGHEILQHNLNSGYPDLARLTLNASTRLVGVETDRSAIALLDIDTAACLEAGSLLARALARMSNGEVQTFPRPGNGQSTDPSLCLVEYSIPEGKRSGRDGAPHSLIAADALLLNDLSLFNGVIEGGTVIAHSERGGREITAGPGEELRKIIGRRKLRVLIVDALSIAREGKTTGSQMEKILFWAALQGALMRYDNPLEGLSDEEIVEQYMAVSGSFSPEEREELRRALQRGGQFAADITAQLLEPAARQLAPEPEASWSVRRTRLMDGTLFDPVRFRDTVGYLYDLGRKDELMADPFAAAGAVPACTAGQRDLAPFRQNTIRLIEERCNGCGRCWTLCPDSALPATVQNIHELIGEGLRVCKEEGHDLLQLERAAEHLFKQAHRLYSGDGLHRYLTLGTLMDDAFERLIDLMGLKEDRLKAMREEYVIFHSHICDVPVVKTERFFDAMERVEKGKGCLLSIAVNPAACKECGLCIESCPKNALEMVEQDEDNLIRQKQNLNFLLGVPPVSGERLEKFWRSGDPDGPGAILLNREAYHTMVGGSGGFPGSGSRIAVHLLAAAADTLLRPRLERRLEEIIGLIGDLENRIQQGVAGTLRINDFDLFSRRLSGLRKEKLDPASLASLFSDETDRELNREELERMNTVLAKLKKLKEIYGAGANGYGKATMAAAVEAPSDSLLQGSYPHNPFSFPWVRYAPGQNVTLYRGLFAGIKEQETAAHAVIRKAKLLVSGGYDPEKHDPFFQNFGPADFTVEERELIPPPVLIVEGALSREARGEIMELLASDWPVKVLLLDHPLPLNVREEESARPGRFTLEGNSGRETALQALTLRRAFVLQSSVGMPGHLLQGYYDGLALEGPALFRVYAPEPVRDGIAASDVVRHARRAVDSRAFPVFRYDPHGGPDSGGNLSLEGNPAKEQDWSPDSIADQESSPLFPAHWAIREGRLQEHFDFKKGAVSAPLSLEKVLGAEEEEPNGLSGMELELEGGRTVQAEVSAQIVRFCRDCLGNWRFLRSLSTSVTAGARPDDEEKAKLQQEIRQLQERIGELEGIARSLDQEHFAVYHEKLAQSLKALSDRGTTSRQLQLTLRELAAGSKGAEDN